MSSNRLSQLIPAQVELVSEHLDDRSLVAFAAVDPVYQQVLSHPRIWEHRTVDLSDQPYIPLVHSLIQFPVTSVYLSDDFTESDLDYLDQYQSLKSIYCRSGTFSHQQLDWIRLRLPSVDYIDCAAGFSVRSAMALHLMGLGHCVAKLRQAQLLEYDFGLDTLGPPIPPSFNFAELFPITTAHFGYGNSPDRFHFLSYLPRLTTLRLGDGFTWDKPRQNMDGELALRVREQLIVLQLHGKVNPLLQSQLRSFVNLTELHIDAYNQSQLFQTLEQVAEMPNVKTVHVFATDDYEFHAFYELRMTHVTRLKVEMRASGSLMRLLRLFPVVSHLHLQLKSYTDLSQAESSLFQMQVRNGEVDCVDLVDRLPLLETLKIETLGRFWFCKLTYMYKLKELPGLRRIDMELPLQPAHYDELKEYYGPDFQFTLRDEPFIRRTLEL